jgi:hypothetical protein
MESLEYYKEQFGDNLNTELMYYRTYLMQTDYVALKIAEANYLGIAVEEKYMTILQERQKARDRINEIEAQ